MLVCTLRGEDEEVREGGLGGFCNDFERGFKAKISTMSLRTMKRLESLIRSEDLGKKCQGLQGSKALGAK